MVKAEKNKTEMPGKPYMNPYKGGVILGIVLFLAYFITGDGLGASGGLNRFVVFLEKIFAPGHVNQVPYLINIGGGPRNPLDHWIVFLTLGILVGGFLSGLINKRLKAMTGKGPHVSVKTRWLLAFIGGSLMGYGARMARGCTSGQGLNGGATLAVGSWAFLFAIFLGGYLLAYFLRKQWN